MSIPFKRFEASFFARLRRKPPSGVVERGSFWLLLASALLFLLSFVPSFVGRLSAVLTGIGLFLLCFCALILLYRWIFTRLLWKVSNRLVVTYLLMGLAPVVLFATLAAIAAYVFSGQFATYAATSALDAEVSALASEDRAFALHIGHLISVNPTARSVDLPELDSTEPNPHKAVPPEPAAAQAKGMTAQDVAVTAWRDGERVRIDGESSTEHPAKLPSWVQGGFYGLVLDGQQLYLRATDTVHTGNHTVTVLSSRPLSRTSLNALARGLGVVHIISVTASTADNSGKHDVPTGDPPVDSTDDFVPVSGGTLSPAAHFYDSRILFTAPLKTIRWSDGHTNTSWISVTSRPTLLYARLTGTALQIGTIVRDALISIAVFFAILELVAFFMAVRLSRTITHSVHDLYKATTEIDRGNFAHRIRVTRRDQLAALSTSFNVMSESLERLLEQQREKERMQSELEIAQEVQNNLFPHGQITLPSLELHGVCKPARMVSGDYYDFIRVGASQLCVTLGDISGKGISAALLMASLHSAVRAYRFAGEVLGEERKAAGVDASPFTSPGKILGLLNRHLYRSTQPEKYATLFLAHYDGDTRKLTYSNGGQLPPFVLCTDGSIKRLDCGGSVVGLLDGMQYQQATVSLDPGDILVAYSDGVTEPENEYGDFGEDRLLDIVQRNRHQPLAAISGHTMQALRAWIGDQEQPDDITLVLARQM